MKNEKLMRAIGQIDEDLILEARQVVRPRRRYVRWAALAACLALLVLVSPVVLIGTMGAGGSKEADMEMDGMKDEIYSSNSSGSLFYIIFNFNIAPSISENPDFEEEAVKDSSITQSDGASERITHRVGERSTTDRGTAVLVEMTETTIRLHLTKTTDEETTIRVGILCDSEDTKYALMDTFPHEEVDIYVNGQPATKLPAEKGEYEILLDFTRLLSDPSLALSRVFSVEGFGAFEGE